VIDVDETVTCSCLFELRQSRLFMNVARARILTVILGTSLRGTTLHPCAPQCLRASKVVSERIDKTTQTTVGTIVNISCKLSARAKSSSLESRHRTD